MTTISKQAGCSAAPATTHAYPVALHGEAINACAMARWYTTRHNHAAAACKAAQALSALRRLQAVEVSA